VCWRFVSASHTLFIHSTGILLLTRYYIRNQLEALQHILDDAVKNIIHLSPRKIGIRLPAEGDIDCVVPGDMSLSKAYKVCYISI